jgi:hypothetical protein
MNSTSVNIDLRVQQYRQLPCLSSAMLKSSALLG